MSKLKKCLENEKERLEKETGNWRNNTQTKHTMAQRIGGKREILRIEERKEGNKDRTEDDRSENNASMVNIGWKLGI